MPFKDTNVALGLPKNSSVQVGRSNSDPVAPVVENSFGVPSASDPQASWVYYDCAVGVMLDSGIVVHNRLPQVNNVPDTLSACLLDDPNMDKIRVGGVNLKCLDQYTDIVQRMGHARYWFRLWGQALRLGYQVPIPGIKTIGGVAAIPYDRNPQWALNRILPGGNYGGVVMWHAVWSLWYTTAGPTILPTIPAADPSAHISSATSTSGGGAQPSVVQAPYSGPDDNSTG